MNKYNEYEIEIPYATWDEMKLIDELLNEAGLKCSVTANTLFAELPYYGKFVEAINDLGFETDEDELD
jgi:putative AlgH/UPF0301 family transcriptional regulator